MANIDKKILKGLEEHQYDLGQFPHATQNKMNKLYVKDYLECGLNAGKAFMGRSCLVTM